MSYVVKDKEQILNCALMLQQREVLLVALLATFKSAPASMTADAHLQQQVMLAALQMFTFIAPGLEATAETYTAPKVGLCSCFELCCGYENAATVFFLLYMLWSVLWLIHACAVAPTICNSLFCCILFCQRFQLLCYLEQQRQASNIGWS